MSNECTGSCGYPRIVNVSTDQQRSHWFERYLNDLLTDQARLCADSEAVADLPMILRFLAERPGWLLSLKELGGLLGLEPRAAKRRLDLLSQVFLTATLPSFRPPTAIRTVMSPRLYLADTGLAAHLLGANRPGVLQQPALLAQLVRQLVVLELQKQATWADSGVRLFHFRAVHGASVDIVLEDRCGRVVGIVVKSDRTHLESDTRGLRVLAEAMGRRFVRGVVLHGGESSQRLGSDLVGLPIWSLWHL